MAVNRGQCIGHHPDRDIVGPEHSYQRARAVMGGNSPSSQTYDAPTTGVDAHERARISVSWHLIRGGCRSLRGLIGLPAARQDFGRTGRAPWLAPGTAQMAMPSIDHLTSPEHVRPRSTHQRRHRQLRKRQEQSQSVTGCFQCRCAMLEPTFEYRASTYSSVAVVARRVNQMTMSDSCQHPSTTQQLCYHGACGDPESPNVRGPSRS